MAFWGDRLCPSINTEGCPENVILFCIPLNKSVTSLTKTASKKYLFHFAIWITFIHSFHLVVCLTTGPKPLPKRALHTVRSRASSFKWEYPLLSLRSSNSFLRLLSRLSITSISPLIFPLITRCRRQFLRKMWPIQFAFRLRIHGSHTLHFFKKQYWWGF